MIRIRAVDCLFLHPFIWTIAMSGLCYAASPREANKIPAPLQFEQAPIQIIAPKETIRLSFTPQLNSNFGPWASSASIRLSVHSILPEWSATVEPVSILGPEGSLPPGRVWVKAEGTGGVYTPLNNPVHILAGDFRQPVRETELEIVVKPSWQDPPGEYQGTLALTPLGPGQNPQKSPKTSRRTSLRAMDNRDNQPFQTAPGKGSPVMGLPQQIRFSLSIPEIIQVAISGQELSFEGVGPEGIYQANQEIRFKVLTNARRWRVICRASNLKSERGEIPAERIKWERVDERGRVLDRGNLGLETTVLRSGQMRISHDQEVILRLSLDVTMADVAGNYKGSISLEGMTGQ